ncbi:MAG: hypothetical protein IPK81_21320 [Rhodospirillales bacterium]|nr:MAG: hypothetical protein IPK81_21320 [Rhodospirillales bacterium]
MRIPRSAALAAILFLVPAAALAQTYSWYGYGVGGGNCTSYKMKIDVTVTGTAVKGLFQQDGRPQRNFEATADDGGAFKSTAVVGGGGKMDVTGKTAGDGGTILLDGYCKFGGPLKKQ